MTDEQPIPEVTGEIVPAGASGLEPVTRAVFRWAFLSASGLQRAELCPWAYALDQAEDPAAVVVVDADGELVDDDAETEDSRDARRGTAGHRFLENVQNGVPRAAALALVSLEMAETCEGIRLDALPRGRPEVAYALDVVTGKAREITRVAHRDYGPLGPDEVAGTADLIVPPENHRGVAMVVDWKFGFEPVTPAVDNLQLAFHALCVRALTGAQEVAGAICKFEPDGRHRVDVHRFDAVDLDAMAMRILAVHRGVCAAREARMRGEDPRVVESQYCKWCSGKPSCPAYAAEAATLARLDPGWVDGVKRQLANPEDASYWWQRIDKAKHVLKEIDKLLRERVQQGPIPLPGGYEVRVLKSTRPRFDGKRALTVLREQFGDEVAEGAATVTVTKKSVREACGEDAEAVFELLSEHGAMSTYQQEQVRRVKAR